MPTSVNSRAEAGQNRIKKQAPVGPCRSEDDGIIGEKQLKVHFDLIRKTEKNIGEIPLEKVGDFRLLKEVLREARGR